MLLRFRLLSVLVGYLFVVYVSSIQSLNILVMIFLQDSLRYSKEVHGNQSRNANRNVDNII
jgi:hypothetical protein